MAAALARTVLYGLIAAASPLAFAATVVVLRSHRARLNGAIYASAFVLAGLGVVLVVLVLGSASAPGPGGSGPTAAALELASERCSSPRAAGFGAGHLHRSRTPAAGRRHCSRGWNGSRRRRPFRLARCSASAVRSRARAGFV